MNGRPINPSPVTQPPLPGEPLKRGVKPPQLLRGMKDVLPVDQPYWRDIVHQAEAEALAFGFERLDPPLLEATSLFRRGVGEDTDIVEKEMYTFLDKGNDSITLRPEFTAAFARAYIEHGMVALPQPVRLYTVGPLFRYDRPQAGRYRQHTQVNFEVLGDAHPIIDAEVIMVLKHFYQGLGISPSFQINSLGDSVCRPNYRRALKSYYQQHKATLCEDCQRRFLKNPLRLLDCKVPADQELARNAPQTVDHLCEACKTHFMRVLEYLDDAEVPYVLNPRLVRGQDYYTRTTFEVWPTEDEPGSQSAIGGGGRYDDLLDVLGGRPTPGVGFGVGVDRLVFLLKERGYTPQPHPRADIFIAQLGEPSRKRAIQLFSLFRREGLLVTAALSKEGIKPQLEIANRHGVKFALIIGQKEIIDDTILLRDMENGIQEVIDFQKVLPEIRKRLSKAVPNGKPATPGIPAVPPSEPAKTPWTR